MSNRLCLVSLVLIALTALCSCEERDAKEGNVKGTGKNKEGIVGGTVMQKTPSGKPWPVCDMAFSPDGRLLAAGRGYHESVVGGDGEVIVWQTKDWKRQNGFSASFTDRARAIAFTADGKSLFAATDKYIESKGWNPWVGNHIYEWTVNGGILKNTIYIDGNSEPFVGNVLSMSVSPDGKPIALACLGSTPAILQRKTGQRAYELEGNTARNESLAFSPNDKSLLSVTHLKPSVRLYDITNGKELASFDLKVGNPSHVELVDGGNELVGDRPTCVRCSGDGKQIAVGVSDGSVRLLTADLSKQIRSFEASRIMGYVQTIAFAAKANRLATATSMGVRLFDTQTGKLLREWEKTELQVMSIALSPDGKLLAVGYGGEHGVRGFLRGGFINVWDTATGRLVKKLD